MPFEVIGSGFSLCFFETQDGEDIDWANPVNLQTIGIDISSVDRERDRLDIALTDREGVVEHLLFSLEEDDRGVLRLRFDETRSGPKTRDEACEYLEKEHGVEDGDEYELFLVPEERPDPDANLLWITYPMHFMLRQGDKEEHAEVCSDDEKAQPVITNFVIED
jgi:hypothetical protein